MDEIISDSNMWLNFANNPKSWGRCSKSLKDAAILITEKVEQEHQEHGALEPEEDFESFFDRFRSTRIGFMLMGLAIETLIKQKIVQQNEEVVKIKRHEEDFIEFEYSDFGGNGHNLENLLKKIGLECTEAEIEVSRFLADEIEFGRYPIPKKLRFFRKTAKFVNIEEFRNLYDKIDGFVPT